MSVQRRENMYHQNVEFFMVCSCRNMPKQPEFDKQILNHTVYVSSIMNMICIISMWIFLWSVICRNMPETARILKIYSVRRHPGKEMEPHKPQITNDDPSFRQVSIG